MQEKRYTRTRKGPCGASKRVALASLPPVSGFSPPLPVLSGERESGMSEGTFALYIRQPSLRGLVQP